MRKLVRDFMIETVFGSNVLRAHSLREAASLFGEELDDEFDEEEDELL